MTNNKLEKELHKPYIRTLIVGFLLCAVCSFLPNLNVSFIADNKEAIENATLIANILIILFLCLAPIIKMVSNKEIKIIQRVQNAYAITDEMIWEEYSTADKTGKLSMTNNFTFIKDLFSTKVIPNRDIVWIYEKHQINNGRKQRLLIIRTVEKKEYAVVMYQEKNIEKCMKNYGYYKHIILGYDKDLDMLYKRNFNRFLDEQYYKETD